MSWRSRLATGISDDEALALAAAVERDSEHTIAQGIVKSAEERRLSVPKAERFQAIPGHGVQAVVGGRELQLGGPALLRRLNVDPGPGARRGHRPRGVARPGGDHDARAGRRRSRCSPSPMPMRDESREAVRRLHDQGVEVIMMTGDARAVADAVAEDLGIDTVFAEVLPEQKASKIQERAGAGQACRDGR